MTKSPTIPRLVRTARGGHHLCIDGKPFLILAGELQNSSFSSAEYMRAVWPRLKEDGINTCLVGLNWATVEPEEGVFDWEELDELIGDARRHDLRLILLWFGSWKNGMSTYVPPWIKRDHIRFPRARIPSANGQLEIVEVLSAFSENNVQADARAFGRLMRHVRDVDGLYGTVVMVQVENEVGLLGATRDVDGLAQSAYEDNVPRAFLSSLLDADLLPHLSHFLASRNLSTSSNGTWKDLFGSSQFADELFMAYHYAVYVDQVTRAGKAEYDLPMFTNAWLSSTDKDESINLPVMAGGGENPGDWPCGGPNAGVLDIWMTFAPSLDFLAPDIYLHHYGKVLETWRHRGQPLFVPEQRRDAAGLRRMWEAYGLHGALAAAPFGIDSLEGEGREMVREHFKLLQQLECFILRSQADPGSCFGFYFDQLKPGETIFDEVRTVRLGEWQFDIKRAFVPGQLAPGYGMIVPLDRDRFLLAGAGYQVSFSSADPTSAFTGIVHFDEKVVENPATGSMKTLRRFNGDETVGGKSAVMPSIYPDTGAFPIAIFIPAGTRIAEVELYQLKD